MQKTCRGNFNRDNLALYRYQRYQRYQQSLAGNANFYFGPKSLLVFGVASFLYELFPTLGPDGAPDLPTTESFFGAQGAGDGGYTFNDQERIPSNWLNRKSPYTLNDVTFEIAAQYLEHPVLFGGNVAHGNFDALNFSTIQNGTLDTSTDNILCLIYQLVTDDVLVSLSGVLELPL